MCYIEYKNARLWWCLWFTVTVKPPLSKIQVILKLWKLPIEKNQLTMFLNYLKAMKTMQWKKSLKNVFTFFFFLTMKNIQWSWLAKIFWIKIGKVFNEENHCKNILILKLLKKNVEAKNGFKLFKNWPSLSPRWTKSCVRRFFYVSLFLVHAQQLYNWLLITL